MLLMLRFTTGVVVCFTYVLDEDAGGQVEMGSFLKGLRLI